MLIEDDRIVAVGPELSVADAKVIDDATDRIVMPGLVDTHRHTWQAALRSVAVDIDLMAYLDLVGGVLASRFTSEDVRVSTLAGALECLDAGITTLQDFSHIQRRPEHADAAVAGLTEAGIRAVFGYGYSVAAGDQRTPSEVRRVRDQYFRSDAQLVTMALGGRLGRRTSVLTRRSKTGGWPRSWGCGSSSTWLRAGRASADRDAPRPGPADRGHDLCARQLAA
ncbi:amidohydrolase family protein [Fodinicola feengrottensis]|uniref:amidohydrolase family protein n=1 Tax=Fodinicola feengrottensis TaxID=435914 RepID=UPI0024425D1E|nr:amidohydrolase family protein [Fodinicola feengrottensis]